jgi:hypothetical protein
MFQVLGVELEFRRQDFLSIQTFETWTRQKSGFSPELELSQSGDAGLRHEHAAMKRILQVHESGVFWARPDQGHVSAHHVHELRKLIDSVATKQATESRDAPIVKRGQTRSLRAFCHRSDLEDADRPATFTHPPSAVDERPSIARQTHARCNASEDGDRRRE